MPWARLLTVVCLSLLPWPAVWFGMYKLNSLIWTFVLYHGVCLLPATIWYRRLWQTHVLPPTGKQWLVVIITALLTCLVAIAAYTYTGDHVISKSDVLKVLTARGFRATDLIPLSLYFILVNATLEELFWRGVVLNELDYVSKGWRQIGTVWTAFAFGSWHYLVLVALLRPGWAELAVAGVILIGIFTSWIYRRTQSIVLPILWHALVFDLAVIAMFSVLVLQG